MTNANPEIEKYDPRDKGWSWIIALGAAMSNFLVAGTLKLFGLFYLEWLELYGESPTLTSWIGSSFSLAMLLACVATDKLKPRTMRIVIFISGVTLCLSFCAAGWMANIYGVMILYGAVGGSFAALSGTPTLSQLSKYFVIKRSLASGIAFAGSSVGGLVLPILISRTNEEYGVRGSLLILGGLFLHTCLIAATLFPLPKHITSGKKSKKAEDDKITTTACLVRNGSTALNSSQSSDSYLEVTEADKEEFIVYESFQGDIGPENAIYQERVKPDVTVYSNSDTCVNVSTITAVVHVNQIKTNEGNESKDPSGAGDKKEYSRSQTQVTGDTISKAKNCRKSQIINIEDLNGNYIKNKDSLVRSPDRIIQESSKARNVSDGTCSSKVDGLHHGGSRNKFPPARGKMLCCAALRNCCNFLRAPHLPSLNLTLFFASFGYYNQFFVIPPLATELGLSKIFASNLIAISSVCELVARLLAGYLGDKLGAKRGLLPLVAYIVVFTVGLAVGLTPSRTLLIIYAPIFGLLGGIIVPLFIPMAVSLVPQGQSGGATGLFPLITGASIAVGTPVLGAIYERTGTYKASFLTCVSSYVVALLCILVHNQETAFLCLSRREEGSDAYKA